MINIKKIVSLLMSVLLIAGSIAAPAFAADSDPVRELPGVGSISNFINDPFVTMVTSDSISGTSLNFKGNGSSDNGKNLAFDPIQDWSEYKYLNMVVKNNRSADSKVAVVLYASEARDLNNPYWYKQPAISGTSWSVLSIAFSDFTAAKGNSYTKKDHVTGFGLILANGDFLIDSIWLSKTQPTATACTAVSVPNGFDDVAADSASFTFTFNNNLAPEAKQNPAKISFKSAAGATVEFDADYSGNKLTITPKNALDYGTSYSINLAGIMDNIGATASQYAYTFTTAQALVVAAKPVIATSAGTVQASTTVTNFTADSAAATLVLACYDGDGKMIKSKTKFEKVELAPAQSSPVTASVTGYSGESVCAFVIDSVEARNLLSSTYATLPAQEPAAFPIGSQTAATAFASGSCYFANDVVTFDDAKLNGGMKRTLLMSILKGDEVTHMSILHNDSTGNVNVSYPMTNADGSGDYVVELKGRKIVGALTGNYTFLSDSGKQDVYDAATSLTGSDDALAFLNGNKKALQLADSTLANDTLMLMTAESLYYNKSTHSDFNDVVSFSKEAVQVCSALNSQTWDTLADYVINNEEILISTNISDFKALSANNRNKVCYSISPLSFSSLSDLNKKLADATRDYLESLEQAKPAKKPSSGGGGGYSVTGPAVVVPPVEETPVPVVPQAYAFDDLADYSWAQESINSLLAEGVISQSADAKYRPADRITRAEFVKLVVSALYDAAEAADGEFADVAKDEWCYNYIAIAAKRGLVNGRDDGTFGKNDYITRQEMAAVIHRALLDLNINLASGLSEYSYGDDGVIADYAKDAVYALYHAGIMTGMADDSFAPAENANRAQAACVIDRIMKGAHNE